MSIIINGMGMPKSGYVDVRLFADGRATTATGEDPFYKIMPLIELPPHGRLIDEDVIRTVTEKLKEEFPKDDTIRLLSVVVGAILDNTPTIVEAEE